MKSFSWKYLTGLTLIALCTASAHSAPSGLNVIPTADVLDKGTLSLELETVNPSGASSGEAWLTQVGLGKGFEVGLDHNLDDGDTWGNVKWLAREESGRGPALALGVDAIGAEGRTMPFVTAYKSFGETRIHAGAIRIEGDTKAMLGLDRPLTDRLTLQADWISGHENAFSIGGAYAINDNLSLTVARLEGNSSEAGDATLVNLAWATRW